MHLFLSRAYKGYCDMRDFAVCVNAAVLGPLTSVLAFLEYYSFSGIGEGINTDLFTNCKCICLNAAV